jgi:hypothetical protein
MTTPRRPRLFYARCALGFSLLEATLGLVSVTIGLSALWTLAIGTQQSGMDKAAAQQMSVVARAGQAYINAQGTVLLSSLAATGDVVEIRITDASATGDAGLPSLVGTGVLPTGYRDEFAFGQKFRFYVRRENLGMGAAAASDHLTGLVVTTGGTALSDKQGIRLTSLMGPAGGFIYDGSSTTASGAYGGWTVNLADWGITPGAGQVAVLTKLSDDGAGGGSGSSGSDTIDGLDDGKTYYPVYSMYMGSDTGIDATSTATNNTAFGYQTFFENTTGVNNMAFGAYALTSRTAHNSCLVLGANSTKNLNTNCVATTSIGYESMLLVGLTGVANPSYEVAVGYQAMYGMNATNRYNVAMGYQALKGTGTASSASTFNVALGYQTAQNYTNGWWNILIGQNAGNAAVNDDLQIAIGNNAAALKAPSGATKVAVYSINIGNSSGYTNRPYSTRDIAIGQEAGYSYVAGSGNIYIGYYAGRIMATSLMAGSGNYDNVAIGASAANTYNRGTSVAFGSNARTGDVGFVVGADALACYESGVSIGYQAAYTVSLSTGQSVYLGAQAGYGSSAGGTTTGRNQYTAIGYRAAYNQRRNTDVVAIGSGAYAAVAGTPSDSDYAVAVGYNALTAFAGAWLRGSTAAGYLALGSNTSVAANSPNLAIGSLAGNYAGSSPTQAAITTGANNLIIGANTSTPTATTASYVMIGTAIRANSSTRQVVIGGAGSEAPLAAGSADLYLPGTMEAENYLYSSDRRLKKNIKPLTNMLSKIDQLEPVRFNWLKDNTPAIGLIAQDVHKIFPVLVSTPQDSMWGVDYCSLISPAMAATQEQAKLLDEINAENTRLQDRQDKLTKHLLRRVAARASDADIALLEAELARLQEEK